MMSPKMRYRLALDIGAKSIGWALLRLKQQEDEKEEGGTSEPIAIIKLGVRIFPDGRNPKDGTSLAVTRRLARGMRRRRDRLLKRKNRLMQALIDLGFFPKDADERRALTLLDPYALRQKALDYALTPAEFARALFHMNQRRGFKSNRKTDKKDNDSGALKGAIARVREALNTTGSRTIGEWLAQRHEKRESVRARLRGKTVKDKAYDFYVDRAMIEAEFDAIWAKQSSLNPAVFTPEAGDKLKEIMLYQRPLKPVTPGRCTLLPDEERAPLAFPMTQRFRIYQEVNNLRILDAKLVGNKLSLDQRNILVKMLEKKDLTFTAIRKALNLPGTTSFNLEDSKRDLLKANATSVLLAKKEFFGELWHDFPITQQEEIVSKLLEEENEAELIKWLQSTTGVEQATAEQIANARLPEGYGSLSSKALDKIVPELEKDVITYDKAVIAAGFESHSALSQSEQDGEILDRLPYYGKVLHRHVGFGIAGSTPEEPEKFYGRIANPTVHIGLNEVRKVVNALIKRYGHPSEVVIEVARELKQSKEKRDEIQKQQKIQQDQNERWREEIRPLIGGATPSRDDIQRMRLWTELSKDVADRRCPYTGEQISLGMLFSDAVEIEHILPFARTLDDSLNNKTVALRRANRDKANKTPFEAFGHSPVGYDYDAILARASLMPKPKAKRFAVDGYEQWLKDDKDFLARALNDTAYLSRIAREYLSAICPHNKVWVIPGQLTAMLRGKFGLDRLLAEEGSKAKNRNDHRHHAIDAAVIGITDRALLKRFAYANQQARAKGTDRLVERVPDPWLNYRSQVAEAVKHIKVSFRPDHGFQGGLHNETAYGLRAGGMVAHRVPLDKFKSVEEIAKAQFPDEKLKEWLLSQTQGFSGKDFSARLESLMQEHGIARVRILEKLNVLPFSSAQAGKRHGFDEQGKPLPYKGYLGSSNYCMEIWCNDKGKWESTVISTFEAYQIVKAQGFAALRNIRYAQNGRPLIMRLMIDDMVSIKQDGQTKIMRVAKIVGNGQVFMAPHNEANVAARSVDKTSGFKYTSKYASSLQTAQGRQHARNII